jgi:hypothetical protein
VERAQLLLSSLSDPGHPGQGDMSNLDRENRFERFPWRKVNRCGAKLSFADDK